MEPTHRKKLNTEQIEVLKLLYRFRFGSNNLIAQYFDKKNRSFVFDRLKRLQEQDLILKRFDGKYRLMGKPASYSLSPRGARTVQVYLDLDEPINLKATYANKTVQEPFIEHCLNIFEVFNSLRAQYGEKLKFFTKTELGSEKYEYFPRPLPDAFISFTSFDDTKRYFVEIIENSLQPFLLKKRIKQYLEYEESGEWTATGKEFPTILFVCESEKTAKKLQKYIEKALNQSWNEDITFQTTTKHRLTLSPK